MIEQGPLNTGSIFLKETYYYLSGNLGYGRYKDISSSAGWISLYGNITDRKFQIRADSEGPHEGNNLSRNPEKEMPEYGPWSNIAGLSIDDFVLEPTNVNFTVSDVNLVSKTRTVNVTWTPPALMSNLPLLKYRVMIQGPNNTRTYGVMVGETNMIVDADKSISSFSVNNVPLESKVFGKPYLFITVVADYGLFSCVDTDWINHTIFDYQA